MGERIVEIDKNYVGREQMMGPVTPIFHAVTRVRKAFTIVAIAKRELRCAVMGDMQFSCGIIVSYWWRSRRR